MSETEIKLFLSFINLANATQLQINDEELNVSDEFWNSSSDETSNEIVSRKIVSPVATTTTNTTTTTTTTILPALISSASSFLEIFQTPPPEFQIMNENSRNVVIAYCIIFLIGASGNLFVFMSVCRQLGKLKWRMTILIVHLSIADLIVTFCVIPSEIFWRMTVGWYGGNLLCKLCQFSRAFGLYLSSLVLICISLDRFFAILYPLKMFEATRRVKGMLLIAWILAVILSIPQSIVFSVQVHPVYKTFQQCVTYGFLTSQEEVVYNLISLSAMYFIPLFFIIFTYSMILWKITQKSREHHQAKAGRKEIQSKMGRSRFLLRSSTDAATMMARARSRTLRMTFIIVLVFVFCWTPYTVMTLWYMFDRESAKKVDERIQDGLFMMVVANSCLNPLVYGNYARETQSISTLCFIRCGSQIRPKYKLPITSVI